MTSVSTRPATRPAPSEIRTAVDAGNIPTLLAVLVEMTGDRRWLADRYRPTRSRGMDDNSTGGLPEDVQAEIRDAVVDALEDWYEQGSPARVPADEELVAALMSFTAGEPVAPEFAPMMSEIVRGDLRGTHLPALPDELGSTMNALVIGAGVAGMLISTQLADAGIEHTVLEKNDEVGGSWYENQYPGAGVDTPSYLYSISSFDHDWSTHFGKRDEVQGYLQAFADRHAVRDRVRFGTEVLSAAYDSAAQQWVVRVRDRDGNESTLTSRILISAVGILNRPKLPALAGMDTFTGKMFHSAHWPTELDEPGALAGKRVAIVGSGASAMQIGPAIVDKVGSLTIFQRSPQWIAPNDDYFAPVGDSVHWLMNNLPGYREWYRARLSWIFNDNVHSTLHVDPEWPEPTASINAVNHGHREFYLRYMRSELGDRDDLVELSTPDYPPFGKRMLLDNGWFRMLRQPDVELVGHGVDSVTETGLVDSTGRAHDFDIIVFATGFHSDRYLYPMDVVGRSGKTTVEAWGDHDAYAYLGITAPDFPNLFILTGPNTALGHGGSFISILEYQVRYVCDAIRAMIERRLGALEVRRDVTDEYNDAVDRAHAQMVWTHPAMTNWYRNPDGRVVAVLPWRIVDYWAKTRHVDLADFHTEPMTAEPLDP
ncbi:NAD(P)/FAD-dependent oxidoreductase [Gordonia alkanivorans]|uniref:flavin-containing monooxygenase n=1 Tax=Gordonia alkanivorans TaxID=84096 RepID=UPI002448BF3D|nr:NAD(P)/FAD-dependent oxidoreductase [Gordonia alkanivorans]MDH3048417.1 NAD(P)/FAD-dependent oxidoreductase [Gordonia alkanivorans]